jgi:hypothetical protein
VNLCPVCLSTRLALCCDLHDTLMCVECNATLEPFRDRLLVIPTPTFYWTGIVETCPHTVERHEEAMAAHYG